MKTKIGVVSDTHDFLDEQVLRLFAGVELILHAGDIGEPAILDQLETIAPVIAVSGNTDDPGYGYRVFRTVSVTGVKFLVQHIVNPEAPDEILRQRLQNEQPRVVVFGHTHRPYARNVNGVFFLNPGYAGKPRFNSPRSVAILECDAGNIEHRFLALDHP